jgi:hypothetical protein
MPLFENRIRGQIRRISRPRFGANRDKYQSQRTGTRKTARCEVDDLIDHADFSIQRELAGSGFSEEVFLSLRSVVMRWFSRRGKNVSGTKNRRRSLLGIEQMENRVYLAAIAAVYDTGSNSNCGVEDDVHQVSYACDDWDMYWGDSSTKATSDTDAVEIIKSQNGDDGTVSGKDVLSVNDDGFAEGIEGSDIGSGGASDSQYSSNTDGFAEGIEGSDIGSGGASDPQYTNDTGSVGRFYTQDGR